MPAENFPEYLRMFPKDIQIKLKEIHAIIKKAAPKAQERISYQMPTFYQDGPVAYFAGYKKHIGFYPTPSAIEHFKKDLSNYVFSKGAVQFSLDQRIPIGLVTKMVKFKLKENKKAFHAKFKK